MIGDYAICNGWCICIYPSIWQTGGMYCDRDCHLDPKLPAQKNICLALTGVRAFLALALDWWNVLPIEIMALPDLCQFCRPVKESCSIKPSAEVAGV